LVADAGLLAPATLWGRLGLEALVNDTVRLVGRTGGFLPGRKVLSLIAAILIGGSHIDHADRLRAGATVKVLGFRVMAPSTLGTFLRAFTFGHVRQLDAVIAETTRRAWAAGAGPGALAVTIDLDSTICEVYGKLKQGAAYGYTKVLGYHPLVATWAETGDVLHARLRKGSSQRGHNRFVQELIARVRSCGATGALTLRADSGFFSWEIVDTLTRLGVDYSITVNLNTGIRRAIAGICEADWAPITYTDGGEAQVAETTYLVRSRGRHRAVRLVVRRTRITDPAAPQLFATWDYHAFITSLEGDEVTIDTYHRRHANVELAIRDLKEGAGLEHCPSGRFAANAAWLACAVLAHNTIRWFARLGGLHPKDQTLTVAATIRHRFLTLPGRLVNHSGTPTLRLPTLWPWAPGFNRALTQIRNLPQLS
jgi:hypothetical protein